MLTSEQNEALGRIDKWLKTTYQSIDPSVEFSLEVTIEPGSSWLPVSAMPSGPVRVEVPPSIDFAIWRFTADVYLVNADNSVGEDPLIPWNQHD